jgi:mannuronan 5-epimerase
MSRQTVGSAAQSRVRGRGIYALIALSGLFVAVLFSFAFGIDHRSLDHFEHVRRPAYTVAPDPLTAATTGRHPQDTAVLPVASADIRAIVVRPEGIALLAGGRQVRYVAGAAASIDEVAGAVGDPSWISRPADGTTRLHAAVILDQVPTFTVTAQLDMVNLPGVFLGAKGSGLTIQDATVRAITEQGNPAPAQGFRPFVMADQGTRMEIARSTFSDLGYDWNGSYGVSWMNGSTGGSTGSTYQDGFIGVYTDHARDLVFRGDRFARNTLYGLDPHSGSRGLAISDCVARENGAHGIIFSRDVTDSSVTGCRSERNGENGIMMDLRSTGNTLAANRVEGNNGDGIVLSDSPRNVISGNTVASNRVGVHVSPTSVDGTRVDGNRVTGNVSAAQGIALGETNASFVNGSQWRPDAVVQICAVTAAITLAWAVVTAALRRRRGSAHLT